MPTVALITSSLDIFNDSRANVILAARVVAKLIFLPLVVDPNFACTEVYHCSGNIARLKSSLAVPTHSTFAIAQGREVAPIASPHSDEVEAFGVLEPTVHISAQHRWVK